MKKYRFIIPIITAAIALNSATLYTNAEFPDWYWGICDGGVLEGSERIDNKDYCPYKLNDGELLFAEVTSNTNAVVCELTPAIDYIKFMMPVGSDDETVINKVSELGDLRKYTTKIDGEVFSEYRFYLRDENGKFADISQEKANEVFAIVGDDALTFEYVYGMYYYGKGYTSMYNAIEYWGKGSEEDGAVDRIRSILAEEGVDAEITVDTEYDSHLDVIRVEPSEQLSVEKYFTVFNKIKVIDNITFHIMFPESVSPTLSVGGTVDMKNAVKGDANNDSEISIADATTILQALGNPDKYILSAQGKYNADIYGNGDGITPMDALAIQQYDAHIIDSF